MVKSMETLRCTLEYVQDKDYENFKQLVQNAEVRKYLGGIVGEDRANRQLEEMKQAEEQYYWTVTRTCDKVFLGLISLDNYFDSDFLELSYQFLPEYWGCGYASEAAKAVLSFGFEQLGLECIVAETQTANQASRRLLSGLGMQEKCTLMRFGEPQTVFEIHKIV